MKTKKELISFLTKIRRFEQGQNYDILVPELMNDCFDVTDSSDPENMICLLYGLDDDSNRFDMTQFMCESIIFFYYKDSSTFFLPILKNINIIYPHAIHMIINVLSPILYDDMEARKLLCDSIDVIEAEKIKIFKEIYLLMVDEDKIFYDECIMGKLNAVS